MPTAESPHRQHQDEFEAARSPSELTRDEHDLLVGVGVVRATLPGEYLFRKGDAGQSMFLIEAGEIRLSFDDGQSDKVLGRGQYFGELSVFIGQHQRYACAQVETPGAVYEINRAAFQSLMTGEPAIVARFMQRSFAYLVAGEHQLVLSLKRRNEDLMQTLDSLRQARSELSVAQQLVRSDELTGLANRRGLYRYLDELAKFPLVGEHLAVLLVDIDHFKRINDVSGHLVGDSALRAVADELRRHAGPMDLPCRLGGDEFALILRVVDGGDLANRALGLMSTIRSMRLPSLVHKQLTVSIGGTFCEDPGGWSTWYSQADASLYEAKRAGGDRWRLAI